jgi:molybdenum cofactor cytidylyltransferase
LLGVYRRVVDGRRLALAALVLAAGAGSRFAAGADSGLAAGAGSRLAAGADDGPPADPGTKLLVDIDGEPMLARVLRAVRAFEPVTTVVVLGHNADAIEQAIDWHDEVRVRNHAPELGLASSLQVGIDTLRALPLLVDGVFIVLGDQPLLDSGVMHALAKAAAHGRSGSRADERPIIAPTYTEHAGPRNPVLLMRPAWHLVDGLRGDHGLSRLMAEQRHLVLDVPVPGRMPDIDRPEDLRALRDHDTRCPGDG